MFSAGQNISFKDADQFNELLSHFKDDAYGEYTKIASHFREHVKANGINTFNTFMVVFNRVKEVAAVVTCKEVDDKEQMYKALAQMLFLPSSINSSLFILAQDAKITAVDKSYTKLNSAASDALVVTFVTPENCAVFTSPYLLENDSDGSLKVIFDDNKSFLNTVASTEGTTKDFARGDMIELFFIFSHIENDSAPFTCDEVFNFFRANGFHYHIIDYDALKQKKVGIPVSYRN